MATEALEIDALAQNRAADEDLRKHRAFEGKHQTLTSICFRFAEDQGNVQRRRTACCCRSRDPRKNGGLDDTETAKLKKRLPDLAE
jgi:hypothetical protein